MIELAFNPAARKCPSCAAPLSPHPMRARPGGAERAGIAVGLCGWCGGLMTSDDKGITVRALTRAERGQLRTHWAAEEIQRRQAEVVGPLWG